MQLENKIRYDRPALPDLASLITGQILSERTIVLTEHATRITLEKMVWDGLDEVARREGRTVVDLCRELDMDRDADSELETAIRSFVLRYFREAVLR